MHITENQNFSRKSKKSLKIIACILGIALIVFSLYQKKLECAKRHSLLSERMIKPLNGIVEIKGFYADSVPYIKLKAKEKYEEEIAIWKLINLGDSISFIKGSTTLRIYRHQKIINVDLQKVYECKAEYAYVARLSWFKL